MRTEDEDLTTALRSGDRSALARAITLVESRRPEDRSRLMALLALLADHGESLRIGITGIPGAGKSTLIDALGSALLDKGHRVAVLAVDPSSHRSGGSILADKTRMHRLSTDARAFVRPTATGGTLGGIALRTRETMLLCEEAGYDRILVETDAPFLAPVPYRGKPNEPGFVRFTAEAVAELRGIPSVKLAELTTRNLEALCGWAPSS